MLHYTVRKASNTSKLLKHIVKLDVIKRWCELESGWMIMLDIRLSNMLLLLLSIIFSVADQAGSGEILSVCQIVSIYVTCNLEYSRLTLSQKLSFTLWVWHQNKIIVNMIYGGTTFTHGPLLGQSCPSCYLIKLNSNVQGWHDNKVSIHVIHD